MADGRHGRSADCDAPGRGIPTGRRPVGSDSGQAMGSPDEVLASRNPTAVKLWEKANPVPTAVVQSSIFDLLA